MWTIWELTNPPNPKLAPPSAAAPEPHPVRRKKSWQPIAAAASTITSPSTQAASGGMMLNSNVTGRRAWALPPAKSGVPDHM